MNKMAKKLKAKGIEKTKNQAMAQMKKVEMKENAESSDEETKDYDSMIENGTSEESDDESSNIVEDSDNDYNNGNDVDDDDDDEENETEDEDEASNAEKEKKIQSFNHNTQTGKRKLEAAKASDNKKAKFEKVKAPTLEEINELKETRNLFHSNLFRLQVKEMLEEIKIKDKYKKFIDNWFEKLKLFLKQLPSTEDKDALSNGQWIEKSGLKLPLNLMDLFVKTEKMKPIQFQYIKPNQEPFLLGAAATNCLLGPQLYIDICIPMPAACFLKDNYLNLVYDQKRALYLTYITWMLLKHQVYEDLEIDNLKFNYVGNNPLKQVLEITPPASNGSVAKKMIFRIFVSAEEQTFKLNRFVPWNNNLRPSLFDNEVNEDEVVPTATQNYNANILFDLTMKRNQEVLNEIFEGRKNFQEGLVLLKVWLKQRQLNVGFGGFNSHILAMFIAYLHKQRKLQNNMSSYQVARTVWNNLAHSQWDKPANGITLYPAQTTQPNQPTMEQFHAYYPVVFVDISGYYNICSNVSLEMYQRVRTEAQLAVNLLNDMKLNSFHLIFMTKYPIYMQMDHFLKINSEEAIEQILEMHVQPADKYNYFGYAYPQILKAVTSLLRKGLKERINSLLPIEADVEAWQANKEPVKLSRTLNLGIVLNPEKAFEVLDKGPESIDEKAEEFRRFWGSKAQLRRFQDGTITESVVWASSADSLMQKRLVVKSIIIYLLKHHFQIEASHLQYIAGDFDVAYRLTPIFKDEPLLQRLQTPKQVDAVETSLLAIRAFDDLARRLQSLKDLALEIITVSGYSSVLRYCDPVTLLPQARLFKDNFIAHNVIRGVIQLGVSGKWPNELGALRALKVAFYIQIAEILRTKLKYKVKVTNDGLMIIKQGFCFAMELAHPKELGLLKKEKNEKGITQYVDCPASIELEKRQYILPKVTSALHALHQQYPSFGPTVMIAKRWLYAQLIDDGLWPDECTELLIASMFLRAKPEQITTMPQIGFFRFLHLLATTNWKSELFVLNFNNGFEEKNLSELEKRFREERESFPLVTIVTSFDSTHYGLLWTTNDKPNEHVLARVALLARQCLNIVEENVYSSSNQKFIHPAALFKASNEGYNLIIQIKPEEIPTSLAFDYGSSFTSFTKPNWHLPLAGTNFLKEAVDHLREAYSDYAAFFYNPCGGKEIAIIWKPSTIFEKKPFKVVDVNGTSICDKDIPPQHVQCQKENLIEDFKFILKDFYLRIDTVQNILSQSSKSAKIIKQDRYFNKQEEKPQDQPKNSTNEATNKINKKFNPKNSKKGKVLATKPTKTNKVLSTNNKSKSIKNKKKKLN